MKNFRKFKKENTHQILIVLENEIFKKIFYFIRFLFKYFELTKNKFGPNLTKSLILFY